MKNSIALICMALAMVLAVGSLFAAEADFFYRQEKDGRVLRAEAKPMDTKSFRKLDEVYAVDKDHVYEYMFNNRHIGYILLEGYDPVDFARAHQSMDELEFSRYLQYSVIPDVDKESFVLLSPGSGGYAKDKNRIYFIKEPLKDVDRASFTILFPPYAKDKRYVWYHGHLLPNADPDSFQVFNYTYAKDKAQVYCYGKILEAADAATFMAEREKSRCGSDKNGQYFDCQRVQANDPGHGVCSPKK